METNTIIDNLSKDRIRKNLLKKSEQKMIAVLVRIIPKWVNSDMLTYLGLFGNIVTFTSFLLAKNLGNTYLLIGVTGLIINWFGDSLDGRLAYYRNIPRKWYGFALDISIDWIGIILIGLGFMYYVDDIWKYVGFLFVAFYGWEMIIATVRYKITGNYNIETGKFGPTEARIFLAVIIFMEALIPNTIQIMALISTIILSTNNIIGFQQLIKSANNLDKKNMSK